MFAGRFQGRTAIVTGAASGIGRGVADRLRAEGAVVSLWDSNEEALLRRTDELGSTDIQVVNIASEQAVDLAMTRSVAALGGRLDILIAGAGISGPNRTTKDYSGDDWRRVIDINLNGTFYCNRAAVREMAQTGYGRIVNIASVAGKEGNPNASAYSASKAAVIGLTKSLGKELASTDVRINCVTPAAIRTPIFDQMAPEHIDFMLSKIPIGRFGRVEEVTALVLWLASDECSFSTGAAFDLSGGRATY
ncbi:SDR family oxidoreductase [Bradyrhizobium diazoefficiens]|uniref:Oxidoreductase n=1 Tax=Bradyrhizobium diazoefficiens TaxID=1355477 RepID=A0A810BLV7_9BRAD|nr:oxidoreductase [Bradyrhizobium diazoefficiens]